MKYHNILFFNLGLDLISCGHYRSISIIKLMASSLHIRRRVDCISRQGQTGHRSEVNDKKGQANKILQCGTKRPFMYEEEFRIKNFICKRCLKNLNIFCML